MSVIITLNKKFYKQSCDFEFSYTNNFKRGLIIMITSSFRGNCLRGIYQMFFFKLRYPVSNPGVSRVKIGSADLEISRRYKQTKSFIFHC